MECGRGELHSADVFPAFSLHAIRPPDHKRRCLQVLQYGSERPFGISRSVQGHETATRHLAQDKAAQSILSVMGTSTQCFEYLRNIKGDFSIKKWPTDDKDRRSVFLTNYSEISDTIRPY